MRPFARNVILTAAAATGAVWLLVWGLIHGWYPALQRSLILTSLNRNLPFEIELDAVRGSLVDGFIFKGLVLRPQPATGGDTVASLLEGLTGDEIRLVVDLTRLYEDRLLIVRSLEASGVKLRLAAHDVQTGATSGTARENPGPAIDQPFRLEIEQIRLRDLTIVASWQSDLGPASVAAEGHLSTRDFVWPVPVDKAGVTPLRIRADLKLIDAVFGPLQLTSGRVKLAGTRDLLSIDFEATTSHAKDLGLFHAAGKASLRLTGRTPALTEIDARVSFSQLNLAGVEALGIPTPRLPRTQLNGELRVTTAQAPDTSSNAQSSRERKLQFELLLDPSQLESLEIEFGHAQFDYRSETRRWRLGQAVFSSAESKVTGTGAGTLDRFDALNLNIVNLPVDVIADALGVEQKVAGQLDLAARLSGPIRDPVGEATLEGTVQIEAHPLIDLSLEIELKGDREYRVRRLELVVLEPKHLQFVATSPAKFLRRDQTWELSDLTLGGPSGGVQLKSARSDGRQHAFDLEFSSLDLQPLSQFLALETDVAGTLSGRLAIEGDAERLGIDADLVWQQPRYASLEADRVHLTARSDASSIAIDGAVAWDATTPLRVTATLPSDWLGEDLSTLVSHPGFAATLALNELPASLLELLLPLERGFDPFETRKNENNLPEVARESESIAGTLTGVFNANGSSSGPALSGAATWTGARLGTAVADNVTLTCKTEAGALLVDLVISDRGRSGFEAAAALDLARFLEAPESLLHNPNNRASLRADGVDLAWLIPVSSARRLGRINKVEGKATGRLNVQGGVDGPQLRGELRVDDARIHLALVKEPIGPMRGLLTFSNDEIRIEQLEIDSSKGPAIATGRYTWNPGELQLDVNFMKFALTHFPHLDARVKGNITLVGSLDALQASGDLIFNRVRVSLPAPEDPLFREVRILGLEDRNAEIEDSRSRAKPSAYQTMRADIAIEVHRGARILERGANFEVEGQFRLRKKPMSPILLHGNLQTTGGTYKFLGRKFDVDEGVAAFEERTPPDPEIRLVATRRIEAVKVGVELTGRWSNLQSRLISVPAMDDTEILSYLVFDKPPTEIGRGDDAELNAAAAQLAGNLALSQLSRVISKDTPINEISMDVNDDMSVASVGVETNVGEDIILRYDRSLQSGAGDRFSVEWRFWKNLSLRSEYDNGGTSGLDLFWSYEY